MQLGYPMTAGRGRTGLLIPSPYVELLLDHVRTRPNADALYTRYQEGPGGPAGFYDRCGFVATGDLEEGGHLARRVL